jgi:hypothetical protein
MIELNEFIFISLGILGLFMASTIIYTIFFLIILRYVCMFFYCLKENNENILQLFV